MSKAVFCIAQSIDQTENIISNLKNGGFSTSDISVLLPDKSSTQDFAHEKHTKAPEGAAIGGTVGFGAGGIIGLLAGIGSLAIPGVGPFIAAGPIMGALSGAAVGAAAGSLTGSLIGLGIPEYEAKRYEGKITGGSALISVHTTSSDAIHKAKEIFEQAHAEDISSTEETSL
ncbi:MAG: hypothetical protein Q7U98_14555 [Methylicorpusculum sp.]|jgi:hypothetical protein|uniref:hypothetical protein n=1 Tax=Methylicorpusculum sp. TaxID=2713644 RepID=UPI00271E9AC5|nr:hypothetical protein [Methylicorpusculum sp.]MDO8846207.1 hypothetical protein [Methylicorpusculum sp.]MDO8940371.1 hypothetical protein [Methylicorpusculum sp.]MDO9240290.1 hypothetical protein [Methylicorpusculum sp.]MDP2179478.1 hypothetical protein [Methylicorpusculum sp.]MDP2204234.1 hypothetical protein [Methylicorpusculum sp.]